MKPFCAHFSNVNIAGLRESSLPDNVSIVMEADIIVYDVENFPTAVVLFFGLHFVLNFEYANGKKSYTFECFQKLFMEMGGKLSPKLLTFKKKLAN